MKNYELLFLKLAKVLKLEIKAAQARAIEDDALILLMYIICT